MVKSSGSSSKTFGGKTKVASRNWIRPLCVWRKSFGHYLYAPLLLDDSEIDSYISCFDPFPTNIADRLAPFLQCWDDAILMDNK